MKPTTSRQPIAHGDGHGHHGGDLLEHEVAIAELPLVSWLPLVLVLLSCGGLLVTLSALERSFADAPRLVAPDSADAALAMAQKAAHLIVVVPAYNEAANIADCIAAILASEPPCGTWSLLVVDDGSSDATIALARTAAGSDSHVSLLEAGPRPEAEHWVGKNWACARATETLPPAAPGDWLLFLDADVRVAPEALRWALAEAIHSGADLLTLAPRLVCGCLAEWLVQPLIASLLGLGFPIGRANDPADPLAFAAGPFLLFRRSSYEAIGGHRAVAGEVVEDLALARAIKGQGLRLRYLLGIDQLRLRMYADGAALWEGWTKNWLLGLDNDVPKALAAGAVVVLLYAVPWMVLPLTPWWPPLALAVLVAMALQLAIRFWSRHRFATPLTGWWLAGLGGLVVGAIAVASVFKTRTGRGWTWRGRALELKRG